MRHITLAQVKREHECGKYGRVKKIQLSEKSEKVQITESTEKKSE